MRSNGELLAVNALGAGGRRLGKRPAIPGGGLLPLVPGQPLLLQLPLAFFPAFFPALFAALFSYLPNRLGDEQYHAPGYLHKDCHHQGGADRQTENGCQQV